MEGELAELEAADASSSTAAASVLFEYERAVDVSTELAMCTEMNGSWQTRVACNEGAVETAPR